MLNFKETYNKIIKVLSVAWRWTCIVVRKSGRAIKKSFISLCHFFVKTTLNAKNSVDRMSRMKRAYITMSFYVAIFIVWQIFAYTLSQTTFVIVNLILVGLVAILICFILIKAKQEVVMLKATIDAQNIAKKKKEQEIAILKSEIMDLKMTSKRQVSFGKKSQAFLDSITKNYQLRKSDEPSLQYLLKAMTECYEICGAIAYQKNFETGEFEYAGEYALKKHEEIKSINEKDGFIGQVIESGKAMKLEDVPADCFTVISGLGQTETIQLYILPIKVKSEIVAVLEISSFTKLAVVDIWNEIDSLILSE